MNENTAETNSNVKYKKLSLSNENVNNKIETENNKNDNNLIKNMNFLTKILMFLLFLMFNLNLLWFIIKSKSDEIFNLVNLHILFGTWILFVFYPFSIFYLIF